MTPLLAGVLLFLHRQANAKLIDAAAALRVTSLDIKRGGSNPGAEAVGHQAPLG